MVWGFLLVGVAQATQATTSATLNHSFLLVAGVQKCGTSELQNWLARFDAVRVAHGEVHFWDCLKGSLCDARCASRLPYRSPGCHDKWNASLTTAALRSYRGTFDRVKRASRLPPLFVEKTPAYYDCAVPRTVRLALPNAKLAFILRDPATRLWSGFFHACGRRVGGRPDCAAADFDAFWSRAPALDGLVDHRACWPPNLALRSARDAFLERELAIGRYHAYLATWSRDWDAAAMAVVFLEVLALRPAAVLDYVAAFLGRPPVAPAALLDGAVATDTGVAAKRDSKALQDDRRAQRGAMGAVRYARASAFYRDDTDRLRAALDARALVAPVPCDLRPRWLACRRTADPPAPTTTDTPPSGSPRRGSRRES